jgi:hypothetical protein
MALVLLLRDRLLALAIELNVDIIRFNIADALFFIFDLINCLDQLAKCVCVSEREREREREREGFVWYSVVGTSKNKRSGFGMKDYIVGAETFIVSVYEGCPWPLIFIIGLTLIFLGKC